MGESDQGDGAVEGMTAEFLSRLVHQLRTPLNIVLGYGDLVQSGDRAGWTEEDRANFDAMMRGAGKILHILEDVGTWTALQAGMAPGPCEPVDLEPALAGLGNEDIDRQGRLHLEVGGGGGPGQVAAPPAPLQQMLRSLAVHALAADAGGGAVTIRTARLPGRMVRIEFQHAGAAISPAAAAGLFQPFARVRAGDHGTGLGLAIAAALCRRMGGTLAYAAAPDGAGGTFRMDLPEAEAASAPPAGPPAPTNSSAPLRVLYVEDVAANRELVGRILRAMTNMAVEFAETAEEGLARVQKSAPDIILMDINLPGIDGFEALRRLKADPTTRHIPVIALTAAANADEIALGRQAPFAAYLTKPIDTIALVDALNAAHSPR